MYVSAETCAPADRVSLPSCVRRVDYPEISLECAKARHRNLLARGINPCEMKATLGKNTFVLRMREWANAHIRESAFSPSSDSRETSGIASRGKCDHRPQPPPLSLRFAVPAAACCTMAITLLSMTPRTTIQRSQGCT
jgi:hypothetical protein